MGFFDSLKTMIKGESSNSSKTKSVRCEELIQFINFAQKIKPLTGGNSGITVSYAQPDRKKSEYTSPIYAEFLFYDLNYIKFARRYALDSNHPDLKAQMVPFYYDSINKDAGITRDDWPYRMDVYDFGRMLTTSDQSAFTALIPYNNDEDSYKMRINAGFSALNGALTYSAIEKECLSKFPNLKIQKHFAYPEQCRFTIQI